jgi:hypothetical protein
MTDQDTRDAWSMQWRIEREQIVIAAVLALLALAFC